MELKDLYEQDNMLWRQKMVELIESGRMNEIDKINLCVMLIEANKTDIRETLNRFEKLIGHMLKWDYQPSMRTRSWSSTIRTQRKHIRKLAAEYPSLRSRLEWYCMSAYQDARELASDETGMTLEEFPENCPYSFDEIMSKEFKYEG